MGMDESRGPRVAEFRLIRADRLPFLLEANPEEFRFLLQAEPRAMEWSNASAMGPLDPTMQIFAGSHGEQARQLSDAHGMRFVLYDKTKAGEMLAKEFPTRGQIEELWMREQQRQPHPEELADVLAAADHFLYWMREVRDGEIGMLSIG